MARLRKCNASVLRVPACAGKALHRYVVPVELTSD